MPALTLAIVASVAIGAWAQRRYGAGALTLTRRMLDAMLYVALPFIAFFVVTRAQLTASAGLGVLLAYGVLTLVGLLAWLLATRVLRLAPPTAAMVVIAAIMANTGYFGAPVVATLLGHDELGAAITYDVLVSAPVFFVAAFAIAARSPRAARRRARGCARTSRATRRSSPSRSRSSRPTRSRPTSCSTWRASACSCSPRWASSSSASSSPRRGSASRLRSARRSRSSSRCGSRSRRCC